MIDALLKSTVIFAAAWTATLCLRRASADLRHRIWLGALFAVAALPIFLWIPTAQVPAIRVAAMPQAAVAPSVRAFPWTFAIWGSGVALLLARLAIGIAR